MNWDHCDTCGRDYVRWAGSLLCGYMMCEECKEEYLKNVAARMAVEAEQSQEDAR